MVEEADAVVALVAGERGDVLAEMGVVEPGGVVVPAEVECDEAPVVVDAGRVVDEAGGRLVVLVGGRVVLLVGAAGGARDGLRPAPNATPIAVPGAGSRLAAPSVAYVH